MNPLTMKKIISTLFLAIAFVMNIQTANAQMQFPTRQFTAEERNFIDLSNQKWQWMAEKDADKLATLFHDSAMFVHMGGSWGKEPELQTIRTGGIWYKHAEIHSQEVKQAENITIVYSNIHLTAEVGGHEVITPFMVTEVYIPTEEGVKLASLVFTRLLTPEDYNNH